MRPIFLTAIGFNIAFIITSFFVLHIDLSGKTEKAVMARQAIARASEWIDESESAESRRRFILARDVIASAHNLVDSALTLFNRSMRLILISAIVNIIIILIMYKKAHEAVEAAASRVILSAGGAGPPETGKARHGKP